MALVLVIGAFAVTPKEHRIEKVDLGYAPVEVEIVEVTREDQKPPEAPKKVDMAVVSDMLEVVTNDTKIETEIDFAEFDVNQAIEVAPVQTEEVFEEEIFIVVEEKASFMGGDEGTFRNWVQQNVKFPQIALENGIQGRVVLSFVIEKDGRLTNIQVLQTPDRSLSEEAIRVLNKSPKWSPGKQRNQAVRVRAIALAGGLSGSSPKSCTSFSAACRGFRLNSLAVRSITSPVAPQPKQ